MNVRAPLIAALGLIAFSEVLAKPSPLPLEVFFSESPRFAECLSPCGEFIAYLGSGADEPNQLRVVDSDLRSPPLVLSPDTNGAAVSSFFWIGRDSLLWQTVDPDGRSRLHLGNPNGTAAREIFPNEKRLIRLEGVVNLVPPSVLLGLSEKHAAFPDLYRVELKAGSTPELVYRNSQRILTWAWDRTGTPVAGLRWTDEGAKELLTLREETARVVFRVAPADDLRLLMASPDSNRVLVLTDRDSDFTHLEWIDLATGRATVFGTDPLGKVDIDGMVTEDGEVLAISHTDESVRWHACDPGFRSILEALQDPTGESQLRILGVDASRKRVLFKRSSGRDPGTLFLHDISGGETRTLWRERPELEPSAMCGQRPIRYAARDGHDIPAFLTTPSHGQPPWPLVVFPHGGPRMRTFPGFDGRVQFLASRGYAVLQPNFRGSRGYGKTFMNAGDGQWGRGVMQTDVEDGVEHLVREGFADPQRVAIMGGSYGGYSALAGLTFTPERYAAAVCLFGISDLPAYAAHSPVEWRAFSGDTARRLGGASTAADRAALEALSPANHAAASEAPLLIYHGAEDHLIPVAHAHRMVEAMRESGKKVDYLLAPGEGHGFSRPESEMAVYRAIELFLQQHLGGNVGPQPAPAINRRLMEFRQAGAPDAAR